MVTNDARDEDKIKKEWHAVMVYLSVIDFRIRNSSLVKTLNILYTATSNCELGFFDVNLTITNLSIHLTT